MSILSASYTMASPSPATNGPTRPENPNPGLEHGAPQKAADPSASTNHLTEERSSDQPPRGNHHDGTPATTTKRKRAPTLSDQFREAHKKRRLADEALKADKTPSNNPQVKAAPTADVPKKGPVPSKPTQLSTAQPNGSTPAPKKKPLTLWGLRIQKGANEGAIARRASNLAVKPSTTEETRVTPAADVRKEKRKLPVPDEYLYSTAKKRRLADGGAKTSNTDQIKARPAVAPSKAATASGASRVEEPLRFGTKREQRRLLREQLFAFEAIKAEATKAANETEDQQAKHTTRPAHRPIKKDEPSTVRRQLTNGEKKRPSAVQFDKVVKKPSGSGPNNQVKVRPAPYWTKQNRAPLSRTDHQRGKSPAIDSDSESEVEEEPRLSLRQTKQQLLAARRKKQLALQAARESTSHSRSSPSPDSPVAISSRSTTPEPVQPRPATPVRDSITVSLSPPPVSTGPDSRARSNSNSTSRSSSNDSGSSSKRSRCSKTAVRRFFKD
ncbi:hypothetical protein CONLIGDRAFT_678149 [Coniochaeta ligniaria NRRL 30616]|uniref:Uncharacterized protein n=1 Tax=Coniochaeta ligniaria NRRL 30616 TaxID=1408157 RepID=A0A1J7IWJ8_9PEZI|nr:hypothetical protein CONLIGDRAFT_678149 [Coniochaeta ligniaria NRRL 30616]